MDLSRTESMLLLTEGLWSEKRGRHRIQIADTILMRNGIPMKWLFTSKEGLVLRKGKQQLKAVESIPSTLKHIIHRRYKSPVAFHTKIARVWSLLHGKLTEEWLDELQLSAKLRSPSQLESLFMVQLHLEGQTYRGGGTFQHLFLRETEGNRIQSSWELKHPPTPSKGIDAPSRLEVPKELEITLREICEKAVGWLEAYSGFRIERALLSFVVAVSGAIVLIGMEEVRISKGNREDKSQGKPLPTRSNDVESLFQAAPQRPRPQSAVLAPKGKLSLVKGYSRLTESRRLQSDSLAVLEVMRLPRLPRILRPASAPLLQTYAFTFIKSLSLPQTTQFKKYQGAIYYI